MAGGPGPMNDNAPLSSTRIEHSSVHGSGGTRGHQEHSRSSSSRKEGHALERAPDFGGPGIMKAESSNHETLGGTCKKAESTATKNTDPPACSPVAGNVFCQGPLSLKGKAGLEEHHFLLYEDRLEYLLSSDSGSRDEVYVKYLALTDVTGVEERADPALGNSVVVTLTGGRHFQLLAKDAATCQVWTAALQGAVKPHLRRASLALIDSDEEGDQDAPAGCQGQAFEDEAAVDGQAIIYDHAAPTECEGGMAPGHLRGGVSDKVGAALSFDEGPHSSATKACKRPSSSPPAERSGPTVTFHEESPLMKKLSAPGHRSRRPSSRKLADRMQTQIPAWRVIVRIEARGNLRMERSTGIITCLRNLGFEPRVSSRDRPTARFLDPAQARVVLTDLADMIRLLGMSVLIQVFTASEPKRSSRSMFHVDLADARARHVKDELRRLGAPGRLVDTRCFWGHKACRELGLPHGARSFMRIQFDLGELRYGKVTTARLNDVEDRGKVRINRGSGKITFVEDIEFSELTRGAGAHSVKFKEQLSAEAKLRDVAELYRMSGMHMVVEAHSLPPEKESVSAKASTSLLASLAEQVHVRAVLVKQTLVGLGVRAVNISVRGLLGSHLNCNAIVIRTDLMLQQEGEPFGGTDGGEGRFLEDHIVDGGAPLMK